MTKVECSQEDCKHRSKAGTCKKRKLSIKAKSIMDRRRYSPNYGKMALFWAVCGSVEAKEKT